MYTTVYKMNLQSNIKPWGNVLPVLCGLFALWIIVPIDIEEFIGVFFIQVFIFLWTVVPVLILHAQYYKKTKNVVFTIDYSKELFFYKNDDTTIVATFDEVESIDIYLSKYLYTDRQVKPLPFSKFYYLKVRLKDKGSPMLVTSIMSTERLYNLRYKLPDTIKYNKILKWYPSIQ